MFYAYYLDKPDAAQEKVSCLRQPGASRIRASLPVKPGKALRGYFIAAFSAIATLGGGLLALVYYHLSLHSLAGAVTHRLWVVFFVLLGVFGLLVWLMLLAYKRHILTDRTSARRITDLLQEIESLQQADQALQLARDLAEAANQAKSRYLTGISHELRTPLQSILGYAQILGRDSALPEKSKAAIDIVLRSSEYLADLIEGLLDISRIEAGKLDIRQEQVDLHELLNQIVAMFRLQTKNKAIDFDYTCTQHLPRYVKGDEKRLRQILINLLTNAVKFTERGRVSFSVSYRSQVAEFVIIDTGVGIGAADLQRIFKPFERIHKSGVAGVQGTGLGLTIVQLLADIMGGEVKVESKFGVGSRFAVKLMLSHIDAPLTAVPPQSQVSGYGGATKTVLVVDDEPTHRGLIAGLLLPLGFFVLEAPDAATCLDLIRDCEPDIFLLDVSMPGMDGLQLAQQLKSSGVTAPIVMLSANAQEDSIQQAIVRNHAAYLVKPVKISALQDVLANLLDLEWQFTAAAQMRAKPVARPTDIEIPQTADFEALCSYAETGYLKGINEQLEHIENSRAVEPRLLDYLRYLTQEVQCNEMVAFLQSSRNTG